MRIIFYLTDSGLTCYNDQDTSTESFDWEDIGLIHDYLGTLSEDTEISLVLDVIDEDIYFEWAPKVRPWEKGAIQKRRKERLQVDDVVLSEVHWTNSVKESNDGRKEELLLSATVNDAFQLQTFLNSLEEAELIVTDIYSKPFLLAEYFKKRVKNYLKFTKQQVDHPFLMISRQSEYAFRQTFFYEGQLRISRLIEIEHGYEDITSALIKETRLAVTYVYNQQIVPFNSPVGLVFLDGDRGILDGMLDRCKEEALVPVTWQEDSFLFGAVSYQDLSPDGRYCQDVNELCFSQQAIVDFIYSDNPKGFYSTGYVKKINNLIVGKRLFIGLNILFFLAGLYYILVSGVDTYLSWKKQEMLIEKIAEHEKEVVRLEEMVKLQDDAQQVKASVEFSESILKLKLDRLIPYDIEGLSEVLAKHGNIQLSSLDWKSLDRFDSHKNEIEMNAWVFPFFETYENPVKWVDALVEDIKMLPTVESVELQKEPLNRDLRKALTVDAKSDTVEALPFSITLRVKDYEHR